MRAIHRRLVVMVVVGIIAVGIPACLWSFDDLHSAPSENLDAGGDGPSDDGTFVDALPTNPPPIKDGGVVLPGADAGPCDDAGLATSTCDFDGQPELCGLVKYEAAGQVALRAGYNGKSFYSTINTNSVGSALLQKALCFSSKGTLTLSFRARGGPPCSQTTSLAFLSWAQSGFWVNLDVDLYYGIYYAITSANDRVYLGQVTGDWVQVTLEVQSTKILITTGTVSKELPVKASLGKTVGLSLGIFNGRYCEWAYDNLSLTTP